MIAVTPAELEIDRQALTVLRRILGEASPREGCALLLGRRLPGRVGGAGPLWRLELIWPCLNVWEPPQERTRRFRLDPREQLLAQKWARRRHLEVLGAAHSHPSDAPIPSRTDLALTAGPTLMVILGRADAGNRCEAPLGCWWLPDSEDSPHPAANAPRPLPWRMVD